MAQTNNSTETDQKNKWGKYFSALVGFILSWILWLLVGSMALWAFQNKSTSFKKIFCFFYHLKFCDSQIYLIRFGY